MKVLLIGGGGREHAIAASLVKSPRVDKLYCAPGNAGIAKIAECVNIGTMDFDKLTQFAKDNAIDLSVCSMDEMTEQSLADALGDFAMARAREWCEEDCQLEVPQDPVVRNLAADIAPASAAAPTTIGRTPRRS